MKPSVWFALIAFAWMALAVGATFRYPLVIDDPFITYRYAQNLLGGQGFVYNTGAHVLSTTTPLYALVLAALGFIFRDIPMLGFWLSVLSLGVCALFVYLSASHFEMCAAGVVAALLALATPGLILTFGLETGFYLALAFGAIYFCLRGQITLAFALLALLTLTRNDGILLAAILGIHLFWKHVPRNGSFILTNFRPFLAFALILTPWLVFAWWWFGTPFPFTLTAKIAQAQSGLWDSFAVGFLQWSRAWIVSNWLIAGFALVGVAVSVRDKSRLLLIILWPITHLVAYSLLGVAFYAWYVAPMLPALALFAGIGLERTARWLAARFSSRVVLVGAMMLASVAMLVFELRADFESGMQRESPKSQVYRRAAEWLVQHTLRDATVDALEVGVIGYYDQRRTVDFVGLVDPIRVPYVRAQELADGVRRASADYVMAIPPDEWLLLDPWFVTTYAPVQEFRAAGFYSGKPLVIYKRADAGRAVVETRMVDLSFDQRVELRAVDFFTRTVSRGESLPVALHLRAREALPKNFKFTLQLVGVENRVVAQADTYYPARLPEDGQPFVDYQALPIARDVSRGVYDLILALYNEPNGERVTLFDARGNEASDFVALGKIEIR